MGSALILSLIALAQWPAGFLVLGRLLGRQTVPEKAAPADADPASVSIIIPARDEEPNLPALLTSLKSQSTQANEIIVVDDASSDRTAEIAREHGAAVLTSQPLPEGWRGKTWACWQGAQAATGDRLLFVDADTWFGPDGLQRIINSHTRGALSVGPYHAMRRPYEQLSAFFNLIMTAGTGAFKLLGGEPNGLFGQLLLVGREDYRRVEGHAAVRDRILENFWLAERFRLAGIPLKCLAGGDALAFRMYPDGLHQLIEGWTKGFASGAAKTPRLLMSLIVVWLGGLAICTFLLARTWLGSFVYLLYAAQLYAILRRIGNFRWYTALLYPIPLAFYFVVFTRSILRSGRSVNWKGRTIHAH